MFRSYQDLVRTPKVAEKPTPTIYHCNMCEKGGWLTENDIEIHKKDAHSQVIHEYKVKYSDRFCTICMTLQDSHNDLISHIKSLHLLSSPNAQRVERMIYICDECTHIFFNKEVLATHMLYVHLTKKYTRKNFNFTCPKCFKKVHLKTIWFHFQNHEIPSVSLCDICLCNFRSRDELRDHMASHKSYYKCETCGYNSTRDFLYRLHLEKHALREKTRRKVSHKVLNSVFKQHNNRLINYNMHNAIKGLNLPKFIDICTLCREICLSPVEKKIHIQQDHMYFETDKKKHVCECGEEFYNNVMLKQHVLKMKGSHRPLDVTESNETEMIHSETCNETSNILREIVHCESNTVDIEQTGCKNMDKEQTECNNLDKEQNESNTVDKEQMHSNMEYTENDQDADRAAMAVTTVASEL